MFLISLLPIVLLYLRTSSFPIPLLPGKWANSDGGSIYPVFFHSRNKTLLMKYNHLILICTLFLFSSRLMAQYKYITRTVTISFFSSTALDNIDVFNKQFC